jgi:hypothetical protein
MTELSRDSASPLRDASVTAGCGVCGRSLLPGPSSQRWCSPAHRQLAYRRRHQPEVPPLALPVARSRRAQTVYACPVCDQRYLGLQYCGDCTTFCVRLGPGGLCPHCDEPLTIAELLASGEDR